MHRFAIHNERGTQRLGDLARTIEWTCRINLINPMFDRDFVGRRWLTLVIETRAIESKEFALRLEREPRRVAFDERPSFIPGEIRCQIFF